MHSVLTLAALALGFHPLAARAATYSLAQSYQGNSFFQGWNFSTAPDQNYGYVTFQSQANAEAQKLVYLNDKGNAVIKVDNVTVGQPADTTFGRNSVLMTSLAQIQVGSLVLFDALHMPYGCSVWPAFYLLGQNWPNNGEIDIVENVNLATSAQYSLHTLSGCQHPSGKGNETGVIVSTDCFNATNGNQGCIVRESQQNSFGQGFATVGGGGFATEFTSQGIKVWFFPRSTLPSDWNSTSPNPDNWPTPSAYYPSSSCNITQFFGPQSIVLDIDICGAFAGASNVYNAGGLCPGQCVDVIKDPNTYNSAYFEIQFLKVFAQPGTSTVSSKPTSTDSSTPSKSGNGGGAAGKNWGHVAGVATLSLVFGLAGMFATLF
ncbi:concanavalin A-like lectin/glucanase domain-containing protein [Cantharellus anzutake]|uniref:concanavalin A-like lectin/glucanase domain-containing protein n=1 Tax=Cantharellus anzutake TaxID=1750568 RepID=UPI0019052E44|nr:concanavalin A-like lectin/glucanase domain-containing protein [Cantharellus anzutake]KAF8336995.1 concanavalin A-like lectin/glucanase domain-containing protein [Cantharellus anzutake]